MTETHVFNRAHSYYDPRHNGIVDFHLGQKVDLAERIPDEVIRNDLEARKIVEEIERPVAADEVDPPFEADPLPGGTPADPGAAHAAAPPARPAPPRPPQGGPQNKQHRR